MLALIRLLVVLALITGPLRAHDLRAELSRLARQAKVKLVLDSSVDGPAPRIERSGGPLQQLEALAKATGCTVSLAKPRRGQTVLVVVPANDRQPDGALRPAMPALREVLVDAMVVHASPAIVAGLRAVGNQLPPVPGTPSEGHQFLDGLGPGVAALSFDRVEPRLHERLPWGDVGLSQPGAFTIRHRLRATVRTGASVQIPLETSWLRPEEPEPSRGAVLKQALEVVPEVEPDGRVRMGLRLRRGLTLPLDVDPSVAQGGRIGVVVDVADGGELLITGLGMKAPEPVVVVKAEPCDPLEPYRRPRLLDHDRCEKVPPPPPPPPTEVVVLILARTVR